MKFPVTRAIPGTLALSFLACPALAAPRADAATPVTQSRETYGKDTWLARHGKILERNRTVKPDLVFIGDSITHFWSGEPASHRPTDAASWEKVTGGRSATNLGFGFDYIENALWRVRHGELDGIAPGLIVINLGTNNLGHKKDGPADCERGMKALLAEIRAKQPAAKILLLGIFPRHEVALAGAVAGTNRLYANFGDNGAVTFLDLGASLGSEIKTGGRAPDPKLFRDGLHPNAAGYAVIAAGLSPEIDRLLGVKK